MENNKNYKKLQKRFFKLINEYNHLKDELMDFDDNLHDPMYWDVQGYCESFDEITCMYNEDVNLEDLESIIEDLQKQVEACRLLLKGFKKLKYVYC